VACVATGLYGPFDHLDRLDAVHSRLHGRVEVLHTEAATVEPKAGQERQGAFIHRTRVDLDAQFGVARELEMAPGLVHEHGQFIIAHECGRTAAQMQLYRTPVWPQMRSEQVHLLAHVAHVFGGTPVILRDDLVARTEITERATDR